MGRKSYVIKILIISSTILIIQLSNNNYIYCEGLSLSTLLCGGKTYTAFNKPGYDILNYQLNYLINNQDQ